MLDAHDTAFARGTGDRDVLVNHKHSGVIVTRKDIRTLASRAWLNDEIMNVYMGLLQVCVHTALRIDLSMNPYPLDGLTLDEYVPAVGIAYLQHHDLPQHCRLLTDCSEACRAQSADCDPAE